MSGTAVIRSLIFAALCWLGLSLPALAQGVGAIGGTVIDPSEGVLPGVTLTLLSPGVIGSGQSTVSDGQGNYAFTRLVPGRYSVKAELQGFQTLVQENIDVNADRTSRADLKLVIGELAETVTVSGQAPLLDTTSALKQTVMTREVLDTLPTGRDVWSITRLAPAIQNRGNDVGGRAMMEQGQAFVHGSLAREQGYLVDGLDVTSPQESAANFFMDTFSAQEMNIQAGQTPADQPKGGVLMNLVTKTGTNSFAFSGMFEGANGDLESNNISNSALRAQLLGGVPARALAANPNLVPGATLQHLFDSAVTAAGPILKDRLWFFSSVRLAELYRYEVGSYNADGTQLLNDNQLTNVLGKGSWAPKRNSQVHTVITWNRKYRPHQNGATATQFADQRATERNDARVWVGIHRWTEVLSPRTALDVAGSWQNQHNDKVPQPEVQVGDIPRFDAVTNTRSVASPDYSFPTRGYKQQIIPSLTYVAGQHDFNVGYHYVRSVRDTNFVGISHSPAGLVAIFRDGVPDSVNTYNWPTGSKYINENHAVYVQDKWRVARKLTLNLGVRFEHDAERVNDGKSPLCQQETMFIQGQCFPSISGVPNLNFVSPRLSAIYDLFGDGRTALKFVANRYIMSQVGQSNLVNPIRLTNDTRSWRDLDGDLIPQLNELGPSTGFNLGTTNRLDPNLEVPYANEMAAEIEQQLPGQVVFSAGYYYRARRNIIGTTNELVPPGSYIPLQVTEVGSGRQVTVYDQAPATRGLFDVRYANHPELDESFHGVDLTVQKRMSNRWMLMGALSLQTTDGDIYTGVDGYNARDLNDPNNTFRRGMKANEVPVFFKMAGAYELPYGFRVGASAQYYQGLPDDTTVRVSSNTVRLTRNNQTLLVEPRGTNRLSSVSTVDLNIAKTLTERGGLKVEPQLNIFNLFNASAITSRVTQVGSAYGNAITILGARLVKFGVRVTF
jgi:hypothetical protein